MMLSKKLMNGLVGNSFQIKHMSKPMSISHRSSLISSTKEYSHAVSYAMKKISHLK